MPGLISSIASTKLPFVVGQPSRTLWAPSEFSVPAGGVAINFCGGTRLHWALSNPCRGSRLFFPELLS
jgi:hypothetical protein